MCVCLCACFFSSFFSVFVLVNNSYFGCQPGDLKTRSDHFSKGISRDGRSAYANLHSPANEIFDFFLAQSNLLILYRCMLVMKGVLFE